MEEVHRIGDDEMSENILRYFAGGNTAKGFYSLYDSNLADIERVLLLTPEDLNGKNQR